MPITADTAGLASRAGELQMNGATSCVPSPLGGAVASPVAVIFLLCTVVMKIRRHFQADACKRGNSTLYFTAASKGYGIEKIAH